MAKLKVNIDIVFIGVPSRHEISLFEFVFNAFVVGQIVDKSDLQKLVATNDVKRVWALETPKILCKL